MNQSESYIQGNKQAWEEAFEHRSPDWGSDIVPRLKNERYPFLGKEVVAELELLDWTGKTVGQFCCNNGRELLSIMKQGAKEGIGFDFAENQVEFANRSAEALDVKCTFIATDILEIPSSYDDKFDFLLITIGSLCWFQDLSLFFEKAARLVKKDGVVLIHEVHPVTNMLATPSEENFDQSRPGMIVNSYSHNKWLENDGMLYMTGKSYASKTFTSYTHSMSAILTAAMEFGFQVSNFQEFERDISGGEFSALENKGIPLSYVLRLRA